MCSLHQAWYPWVRLHTASHTYAHSCTPHALPQTGPCLPQPLQVAPGGLSCQPCTASQPFRSPKHIEKLAILRIYFLMRFMVQSFSSFSSPHSSEIACMVHPCWIHVIRQKIHIDRCACFTIEDVFLSNEAWQPGVKAGVTHSSLGIWAGVWPYSSSPAPRCLLEQAGAGWLVCVRAGMNSAKAVHGIGDRAGLAMEAINCKFLLLFFFFK